MSISISQFIPPPRNLPKSGWKEIYEFITVKFCEVKISYGNAPHYYSITNGPHYYSTDLPCRQKY